jgi:hypothetical protein
MKFIVGRLMQKFNRTIYILFWQPIPHIFTVCSNFIAPYARTLCAQAVVYWWISHTVVPCDACIDHSRDECHSPYACIRSPIGPEAGSTGMPAWQTVKFHVATAPYIGGHMPSEYGDGWCMHGWVVAWERSTGACRPCPGNLKPLFVLLGELGSAWRLHSRVRTD